MLEVISLHIAIKVAKGKSIIDFKLFNHKVDRAVTYKELGKLVDNGGYDLVILEDIDASKVDIVKNVASKVRTALVCGRALEYAEQVNIAESIGIDVITQAGEVDDYINRISGETVKFKGNSEKVEVEPYTETQEPVKEEDDGIVVVEDTDENTEIITDTDEDTVTKVAEYALNDVEKPVVNVDNSSNTNVGINVNPIAQGFSAEILLDQIEQYKRQSADFEKDIDKLTERLRNAEQERDDYSEQVNDLQHKLEVYKDSSGDKDIRIESYVSELSSLRGENKELRDKTEGLEATVKTLQESLNSETGQLATEKNDLIDRLEECKKESSETFKKYNELVEKVIEARKGIIDVLGILSDGKDTTVTADTVDTAIILNSIQYICEQFRGMYDKYLEYRSGFEEVTSIKENLAKQSEEHLSKIQQLEREITNYKDLLSNKDETIRQQNEKINAFNADKASEFRDISTQLNESNASLSMTKSELESTKAELDSKNKYTSELSMNVIKLEKELSSRDTEIQRLNNEMRALKLSSGTSAGGTVSLSKGYTGSARIIQVFGSGSYGVTTMAMTLSHKFIGKRVIFLDFDLVSPKADSWFGINPVCDSLVDIENPVDKTGVAALLNNGTNYVIRNFDKIVKHRINQRDFVLDYFSGVYNTPQSSKVYSIDYSLLFNFLSDRYDYIVVDSGRLGSSDAYDSVIRTINDMAHKNVVITLSDKFDIRTQKVKMDYASIDMNKSIWVMNMGDNNVITSDIKKMLGDIKMVKIAKVLNYYGIKKPMDIAVPMLKIKIDEIVKSICI